MPLTRKVTFTRRLEKGNRVQIPNVIRWEYKIEPNQTLRASFSVPNRFKGRQFFYTKMEKAGKIHIPKEIMFIWQEVSLPGYIVELTLEPA